jgi:beta-barrel assembly-enhancing protease
MRFALPTFLTLVLLAPLAASAQGPSPDPPVKPDPETVKLSKTPVTGGQPTTRENVYLPTEGEVKLGRETAVEVEKQYKLITSGPQYDRVQRIGREVSAALLRLDIIDEYRKLYKLPKSGDKGKRVPFEFTFKVVDTTKEVNAFSLAGGPIYVTKGLLDYTTSDHELAAVLAHEATHTTFHHVDQIVKKQRKVSQQQMWGLLAVILAGAVGGGSALSNAVPVLMGAQLVTIAAMSGYGQDLETEADRIGVKALTSTQYNPVGMLTFMQKLARDDRLHSNPNYGAFQSHPYTNERVAAIGKELNRLGYKTDIGTQRLIGGRFRLDATPERVNGKDTIELRLNGADMFTVAAEENGRSVTERAQWIAEQLKTLMGENAGFNDVKLSPDKTVVSIRGIPVIKVLSEDAAYAASPAAAGEKAYKAIVRVLLQESLDLQH